MTNPDGPPPEEEARLRRLLADARETGPTPPDVVARLDRTLAELSAELDEESDATVVPLARRRRRRVAGLLAAAAVVVVGGVGISQIVTGNGQDPARVTDADSAVERGSDAKDEGAAAEEGPPSASVEEGAPNALPDLQVDAERRDIAGEVPTVGRQRLHRDALGIRRTVPAADLDYDGIVLYAPEEFRCVERGWGTGVFVGVRYAGRNAVLAFRQPSEQNQLAEVLQCGTGVPLRSVTLSAP